jgi:hypothetical protein
MILQQSGLQNIDAGGVGQARRDLIFLQRVLEDFAEIWEAAGQNAQSLRTLEGEYCVQGTA